MHAKDEPRDRCARYQLNPLRIGYFNARGRRISLSFRRAQLPSEWNRLYREYLGVTVPDDRRGCLQDVHWSCGLFGYFPTYTLGNLYAAQFARAARAALGDPGPQLERGDFAPLREWLRREVHRHGRRHEPGELCRVATGSPLSADVFVDYLEDKLERVYALR